MDHFELRNKMAKFDLEEFSVGFYQIWDFIQAAGQCQPNAACHLNAGEVRKDRYRHGLEILPPGWLSLVEHRFMATELTFISTEVRADSSESQQYRSPENK